METWYLYKWLKNDKNKESSKFGWWDRQESRFSELKISENISGVTGAQESEEVRRRIGFVSAPKISWNKFGVTGAHDSEEIRRHPTTSSLILLC